MVAVADVFMRLRLDTSHAAADGKVAGEEAGKSFGDGFTRDSSGRLRDARGRFVKDMGDTGKAAGAAFGKGLGDEAAKSIENVGKSAKGAEGNLADLGGTLGKVGNLAMPALIGAGVALSPVLVTLGTGAAGLGVAAASTVAPILKAAGAAGGLEKNLTTLSPVQQLMARQLLALEGNANGFAKSLQPQVVKLWGDSMGIAGGILKNIQPVARTTGDALHQVLVNLNANFHTQQWQDFFRFMAQEAGPDAKLLGQNLIDLVNILPQLLTQLQPVATELLQFTDATFKLVGGLDHLASAQIHVNDTSKTTASLMDTVTNAVKQAAIHILPGVDSAELLQKGLSAVSSSGHDAAGGITAAAKAAVAAAPVVGTLAGDVAILGSTTSNTTLALQAYNDIWNILIGNAVSQQQAVLNVKQAFESYNAAVKASGRTSTQAQQAFLNIFQTLGTGLDALHKQGAGVGAINSLYVTTINRLRELHNLTPQQRGDIAGLTRDYQAWAESVTGLSGNTVKAAQSLRQNFLTALAATHQLAPAAKDDADKLAAAILKTGTNSAATAADRNKLINDLVKSGVSAFQARQDVAQFQSQIDALHGKSVNVDLTTSGSGTITITGTGINQRTINTSTGQLRGPGGHTANGWLVSGGIPNVDSVPIVAMAGELVVPKWMVNAGYADNMRGMIPGFAAGGVVGKVSGAEGGIANAEATWGQLAAVAFAQAAIKAQQKALSGFLGLGSGNYAADIATVLTAKGLPLSLVPNWLSQIQTESGGNLQAVNLTDSNAQAGHPSVGLLQIIPSTWAAFSGPYRNTPPLVNFGGGFVSENAFAQIYTAITYALARYGTGMGAVIGHGHGYDRGGVVSEPVLGIGLRSGERYGFAMNGVPETVVPGTAGRQVHVHFDGMVVIREEADLELLAQKLGFAIAASGAP